MATACTTELSTRRRSTSALVVALAGNPNVGKSTLFNRLTGSAVETANYPGMTVGLNIASATWRGQEVQLVDLPGTYGLDPVSEDQWVARHGLLDWRPDVVVAVVDATNLARNLYLVLQLVDLGPRVVIALNLIDEARRQSLRIDPHALSQALGLPVIPTVARRGEGIDELIEAAAAVATGGDGLGRGRAVRYSARIETQVAELEAELADDDETLPDGLPPRAAALALLEGDEELVTALGPTARAAVTAERAALAVSIAAARHAAATAVAEACTEGRAHMSGADRWWRATTSPLTGLPILLGVLAAVFAFLFFVGGWLSSLLTSLWTATASPLLASAVHGLFGYGAFAGTLLWGLDGGILAALAVGIPYILTFYFVLALLEDSGYMNAAAFLADRVMHSFGLHGRAVIPLMAAAGCNVPAIMGTRVLATRRERTIACALVVLVPCSARTAVILGSVSLFVGWQWALLVFGVLGLVGLVAGLALNRVLPGEPEGLVMEMFPFRRPSLRLVAVKTWKRFGTFLWAAAPIMLIGSFALGALYETGLIWHLEYPLNPVVVGWLGLPAVAGLTLLLAVLRKELALQMLVVFAAARFGAGAHDLRSFMTPHQIVVYALVAAIFIPCVATIAMLGRELGWRRAGAISAGTVVTALVVGGAAAHLLPLL
ncbi:MAG TPA: ferrous iron transport protein B [Thermoleophilia bacterium]|nr:ferrous iron transport protein B [Thermoleophilia bacterium]